MTATADLILERRRVRRRLAFWRILAIVAVVVAVGIGAASVSVSAKSGGEHVARIWIDGVIVSDHERADLIEEIAKDDTAKALLVRINSPGGTVAGSEELYEGLRRVAEIKPVVAVMSEAAASGGYITAIAADHIVARGNTLTGSIGVVAEAPNIAGLLESVGVNVTRVKSAPLKAEPGFLTEPVPGAFEAQQRLIDDSYDWFRELVGARRGIEGPALDTVADGRAFTGREALALDLIDELGGETEARSWLETEHSIAKDTELRTRKWGERDLPWPLSMVGLATGDLTPVQLRLGPGPRLYALMY